MMTNPTGSYCRIISRHQNTEPICSSVIINADDFGLSKGINKAIIKHAESGNITSASILAVGPELANAANWAGSQDRISIGVHLCLTDNLPSMTNPQSLINESDSFHDLGHIARRAFGRSLPLDQVKNEWKAQISSIRSKGINLTHMDSHQHVHMLPGISEVAIELAKEERLAVRHTYGHFGFSPTKCIACSDFWRTLCLPSFWKSMSLRWLGRRFYRMLRSSGIPTVDSYVSPSSLCLRMRCEVTPDTIAMITRLAGDSGGIVEWVTHPSRSKAVDLEPHWMSRMRSSETSFLDRGAYVDALRDAEISTSTWDMVAHDAEG